MIGQDKPYSFKMDMIVSYLDLLLGKVWRNFKCNKLLFFCEKNRTLVKFCLCFGSLLIGTLTDCMAKILGLVKAEKGFTIGRSMSWIFF